MPKYEFISMYNILQKYEFSEFCRVGLFSFNGFSIRPPPIQGRPELVCQRRSEEVDFSGVLEAILTRLEIVVYLSTCLVDNSNLVRPCPQARAARKRFEDAETFYYNVNVISLSLEMDIFLQNTPERAQRGNV